MNKSLAKKSDAVFSVICAALILLLLILIAAAGRFNESLSENLPHGQIISGSQIVTYTEGVGFEYVGEAPKEAVCFPYCLGGIACFLVSAIVFAFSGSLTKFGAKAVNAVKFGLFGIGVILSVIAVINLLIAM